MTAPIIFPDVELLLCGYLRTALASYGFPGMFVSNARGSQVEAVWVRRDGGPALDQVREAARVSVNVFAATEQRATDLARTVSALMVAAPNGAPIVRVEENSGPSPIADATGPRRFMSFDVTVRGTTLSPA